MTNLCELFNQAVIRDGILQAKDKALVACSAGPDSVALFHLLRTFQTKETVTNGANLRELSVSSPKSFVDSTSSPHPERSRRVGDPLSLSLQSGFPTKTFGNDSRQNILKEVPLRTVLKKKGQSSPLKLALAYFNHGLRSQAAKADENFIRKLAKAYHVPVYFGKGNVLKEAKNKKASLEEAARKLRYTFLTQTAKRYGYKKVVLAHHQNDQAETVLMRILQGTGLRGLCGIRKAMKKEGVLFYRPLLEIKKTEILDYLKRENFSFRQDLTNQSFRFLRNQIRHKLLPLLAKAFNPRILEALSRIPDSLSEEVKALEVYQKEAWRKCLIRKSVSKLKLDKQNFLSFPSAIQFQVLNQALQAIHPQSGLSYDAWKRIQKDLKLKSTRWTLPKNISASLDPSYLILEANKNFVFKRMERQHKKGYRSQPVSKDEFSVWETEQAWGVEGGKRVTSSRFKN